MANKNNKNVRNIAIGAAIGAVTAGAAALLLAPKKGSELRKDIATKSVGLKEKTATVAESAKIRIQAIIAKVKKSQQEQQEQEEEVQAVQKEDQAI